MSMHRQSLPGVIPFSPGDGSGTSAATLSCEQRAAIHYSRGEKERAMECYREAARLSPGDAAVQKAYADFVYVALGRTEEAVPLYQRVLDLRPNDCETLQILGNLCAGRQGAAEARSYFTRLLAIEPWNAAAKKSLDALPVPGESDDAFKEGFRSAQQSVQNGDDEGINAALDHIVQLKQAAANGTGGAEQVPSYAEIQQLASSGKPDRAIAALELLVARTPQNALAHNDLGVLYAHRGESDKAITHYRRAVSLDSAAVVYQKNLADFLYMGAGDIEGALQMYVKILKANPRDIETLTALAQICVSVGKSDDARFFYDKILEIEPWNQSARQQREAIRESQPQVNGYQRAQELARGGKTLEARQALEEYITRNPDNATAHNDLGVLCYQTGLTTEALAHYEEAVRLDGQNVTFQKNLGEFYSVALGRHEEALKILVELLRKNPRDAETLVSIGKICDMLGRTDDARDFYQKALEAEPWNIPAREMLKGS